MACTFFGHRYAEYEIKHKIKSAIEDIIKKGEQLFYVGNHGQFDMYVHDILIEMKKKHPQIKYYVVFAYPPGGNVLNLPSDGIFPSELYSAHFRQAIPMRNKWMVDNSDIVITYVTKPFGGAARFKAYANSNNKTILELGTPD